MNQIQDDEINLFELFQTLWDGKWFISAFTLIAMLTGTGYIYSKKPQYESFIKYSFNNLPPFYDYNYVKIDFKKNFHSKTNFDNWKQINGKTSFVHEDISFTEVINGIVLTKRNYKLLATVSTKPGSEFILARTNNLSTVDDLFKYAQFINNLLKEKYVIRSNSEIKIMSSRIKEFAPTDSGIVAKVLSVDRFFESVKNKSNILRFDRPSKPQEVSIKSILIFSIFVLSGAILGVLYVLISKAIANRKERLLKA